MRHRYKKTNPIVVANRAKWLNRHDLGNAATGALISAISDTLFSGKAAQANTDKMIAYLNPGKSGSQMAKEYLDGKNNSLAIYRFTSVGFAALGAIILKRFFGKQMLSPLPIIIGGSIATFTSWLTGFIVNKAVAGAIATSENFDNFFMVEQKKYPMQFCASIAKIPNAIPQLPKQLQNPDWKNNPFAKEVMGMLNSHGIGGMGDANIQKLIGILQQNGQDASWPNIAGLLETVFGYNGPLADNVVSNNSDNGLGDGVMNVMDIPDSAFSDNIENETDGLMNKSELADYMEVGKDFGTYENVSPYYNDRGN